MRIRLLYFIFGFAAAAILAFSGSLMGQANTRAPEDYGMSLNYDAETPLPVPPLSFFTIGVSTNAEVLDRVYHYCTGDYSRLSAWFGETHPERLLALCGMYIVATNAPYHEQPHVPENAITLGRQAAQHCGTVIIAQGEIYERMGLIWLARIKPGHGWIDVLIDGTWETFDASVNVWYGASRGRRMFYIPDFPGAFDHERYCYTWGCYNMLALRTQVYDGVWYGL